MNEVLIIILAITIILLLIIRISILLDKDMGDLTGRYYHHHTPNDIILKVEYMDESGNKKVRTATPSDIKKLKRNKKLR